MIEVLVFIALLCACIILIKARPAHSSGAAVFDPPRIDTTCLVQKGIAPKVFQRLVSKIQTPEEELKCSDTFINPSLSREFCTRVVDAASSEDVTYFLTDMLDHNCARVKNKHYENKVLVTSKCMIHESTTLTTIRAVLTGLYDLSTKTCTLIDVDFDVCSD